MKKLLALCPSSDQGGGSLSFQSLVSGLDAHNLFSVLVVQDKSSRVVPTPNIDRKLLDFRNPLKIAIWAVLKRLQGLTPSVIYGSPYVAAKWIWLFKCVFGATAVCHLRESLYDAYGSFKGRLFLNRMDHIIAISESVALECSERAGVPKNRITVIPNGVEPSQKLDQKEEDASQLRCELGIPKDVPLITMVARTDPLKGHGVFIEAARLLRQEHSEANFMIVGFEDYGVGSLGSKLSQQITEAGLGHVIHLRGHEPDARYFMRASSMVVIPSTSEGFGRVAIEAMMEQTPVIASRVGGLGELFENNLHGLYVDPGDPKELASKMLALLNEPEKAAFCALQAKKLAEEQYSIEKAVLGVLKVLEKVVKAG